VSMGSLGKDSLQGEAPSRANQRRTQNEKKVKWSGLSIHSRGEKQFPPENRKDYRLENCMPESDEGRLGKTEPDPQGRGCIHSISANLKGAVENPSLPESEENWKGGGCGNTA